ncbi:carboxylesterase family protein [Caulobacter sp. 73W]|uniref:Carboxylic ester hydrolase n=1 Tax=Caulobacter sp. 73W TaxID=3161137 RepID=A0AB39KYX0_9CAUL
MALLTNRRGLLTGAFASGLAGFGGTGLAAALDETQVFPVAQTADGKIRGLRTGGISAFRGVPYGASTAGPNRFLPPQPVKSWIGVRDCLDFGSVAPQAPGDRRHDYADLILNDVQPGGMGEDCLVLNLWTPALDGAKRPVLVRFHGGGFYGGSSNGPGSDGEMLARFGDCVVVTVNHRLSAFGYLHLGDDGAFADAGVAGLQDLVAALGWVRTNIDRFGGDPSRVLIFGQSGGGAKVCHLMAMPSAKGLFHRAAVMSGPRLRAVEREDAAKASSELLSALGLQRGQLRQLQALPYRTILVAQMRIEAEARRRGEAPNSFAPVLGDALPRHPFDPDAPQVSAHVPLMVSTVLDERTYRERDFHMTWDGALKRFEALAGEEGPQVLSRYRQDDPNATPFILCARAVTDQTYRRGAALIAERKAAQAAKGGAAVWSYLWTQPSPAWGGRYGAPHGIDVAAAMHDVRLPLYGPTDTNRRLADALAGAFVAFAATGDPATSRLGSWPAYDPDRRATMVFGEHPAVADDPRGSFRRYWARRAQSPLPDKD